MAKWGNIPMNIPTMMNVVTTQRRRCCAIIQMNKFCNINALIAQRCRFYAGIPMNVSSIMHALMVQRRRCCSFDSPGLARNEPTPGKRSQGDSTP